MAGTLDQNADELSATRLALPDTKRRVVCKSKDGRDHVGGTDERGEVVWLEDEQIPRALAFLTSSTSSGQ